MKKLVYILIGIVLTACSSQFAPIPQLSFVETMAVQLAPEKGKVRYVIRYQLAEDSTDNLYAEIRYQDLTNREQLQSRQLGTLGDVKVLNFNSLPADKIKNKEYYQVSLLLYNDSDYSELVGIHDDLVWFEMSENIAELLKINLF